MIFLHYNGFKHPNSKRIPAIILSVILFLTTVFSNEIGAAIGNTKVNYPILMLDDLSFMILIKSMLIKKTMIMNMDVFLRYQFFLEKKNGLKMKCLIL